MEKITKLQNEINLLQDKSDMEIKASDFYMDEARKYGKIFDDPFLNYSQRTELMPVLKEIHDRLALEVKNMEITQESLGRLRNELKYLHEIQLKEGIQQD